MLVLIVQEGMYEMWGGIIQRMLAKRLGESSALLVPTTESALREIQSRGNVPATIVCLTRMKGIFEKAMRAKKEYPELRVVVLTGLVGDGIENNKAGVVIIDKGIEPGRLADAILGQGVSPTLAQA